MPLQDFAASCNSSLEGGGGHPGDEGKALGWKLVGQRQDKSGFAALGCSRVILGSFGEVEIENLQTAKISKAQM